MNEDISRKTILVLVILTIIVSTLGTFTVLDTVNRTNFDSGSSVQEFATTETSGLVTLKINEPVRVTGNVILTLVK